VSDPPGEVIVLSGDGPDRRVERLLDAMKLATVADVLEVLAPGRFRVR